jgi:hypothetical protein
VPTWRTSHRAKLGVAVAVVVLAGGHLLGLWSTLGSWLEGLWYFLADSTPVPNWLLGLFALCAVIVAGWLGAALAPRRRSPISTQDDFFNIRWRWSYGTSGGIQDLTPHCLRCGHRLVLEDVGRTHPADRYECRCDRCGTVACEIDCPVEEFESRVLRKIHETTSG